MSDFYRNQPDPNEQFRRPAQGTDGWANRPMQPAGSLPEDADDAYEPWDGRPAQSGDFLAPTALGAELQRGGVPLYGGDASDDSFLLEGDNAPTRLAKPLAPAQKIVKRTTVERQSTARPENGDFSGEPARSRINIRQDEAPAASGVGGEGTRVRRRRMERRDEPATGEQAAHDAYAAAPEASGYDLFSAGDSELPAQAHPAARTAEAGGRYTGARTAMPGGTVGERGAQVRDRLMAERAAEAQPYAAEPIERQPAEPYRAVQQDGRRAPMHRQVPQGGAQAQPRRPMPGDMTQPPQRPMPQGMPRGVRPDTAGAARNPISARPAQPDGAPARPPRVQMQDYDTQRRHAIRGRAVPPDDGDDYNPQASVPRKRYDFEDEPVNEKRKRRSPLLAIVIILLIIGGLLAAICLPDWDGIGGTVGGFVSPIKASVVSVFNKVKNLISPEPAEVKSFSVTASDSAAPAQLMFTVQTTRNTAGIRISNDEGLTLYQQSYAPDLTQSGELIENSNAYIWKPVYRLDEAYSGGFTVYALDDTGVETVGFRCAGTVSVEAPKPAVPAIQSFNCDTQNATSPARLCFTLVTSPEVTAVRVIDQYSSPLVTMYDTDSPTDDKSMTDNGDARVWTLCYEISGSYSGSCYALYQSGFGEMGFTTSDYGVKLDITEGAIVEPIGGEGDTADDGEPEQPVVPTEEPTPSPTPSPSPEPTPEPTPEPPPAATPLPFLGAVADASANPEALNLTTKIYQNDPEELDKNANIYQNYKSVTSYSRANPISMLSPFTTPEDGNSDYAVWKSAGVLTFRSGPFRQNAAYGTVDVQKKALSAVWSNDVGSMRVNAGPLYGVVAPGQPIIVKWPVELRARIGLFDAAKTEIALKEVIVSACDGKIYFYNLLTGEASRDPIDIGAPSAGGLSLNTNGVPILGVGQSHSKLAKKSVKNGYHLINLLTNEQIKLFECDGDDKKTNYTGVYGAALFNSATGAMIFAGQNGVLYTVELGPQKEIYDNDTGMLKPKFGVQGYSAVSGGKEAKNAIINTSIAMYSGYAYYGDGCGILQCVNVNTMSAVWARDLESAIAATPALDMEDDGTLALYTGNTLIKNGTCVIRRIDALSGKDVWSYEVPDLPFNNKYSKGLHASPAVGSNAIDDLVIFTVAKGAAGSAVIAFNKSTGAKVWETALPTETVSCPVIVYNAQGDAWVIQAEKNGAVNLLDGKTGELLSTHTITTANGKAVEITASPAVYGNLLVIGTTGKNSSGVYCLRIE